MHAKKRVEFGKKENLDIFDAKFVTSINLPPFLMRLTEGSVATEVDTSFVQPARKQPIRQGTIFDVGVAQIREATTRTLNNSMAPQPTMKSDVAIEAFNLRYLAEQALVVSQSDLSHKLYSPDFTNVLHQGSIDKLTSLADRLESVAGRLDQMLSQENREISSTGVRSVELRTLAERLRGQADLHQKVLIS